MNVQEELIKYGNLIAGDKKTTMEESIERSINRIKDTVSESKAICDSYGNTLLSIGTKDPVEKYSDYQFSNDSLNYLLWLALYNDSWVFRRAIDKPAQDEIKCGISIIGEFEQKSQILRDVRKLRSSLIQLLQWGALFGGSIAVCMFDNLSDEDYSHSINWEKIRESKTIKLYVTDRWYGCSPTYDNLVTDMTNIDYSKPEKYGITFADGKQITVHHDYILRYEHRFAPPLIKTGQLQGWGYAEGAHIINELNKDDKLRASIQSLIDKSLIEVIKMAGMRGLFMGNDPKNEQLIEKRLNMVNYARNFNSLTFLDKDDEYSMNQFSGLAGLADLLEQQMLIISSALDMQGVLYGPLEKGFSNDPDAMLRYSDVIHERCESFVRPVYEKLLWILYNKYDVKDKIDFEFISLIQKTELNNEVDAISKYNTMLSDLLANGIINTSQYAKSLLDYINNKSINVNITDDDIRNLEKESKNESEDIDLI